MYDTVKSHEAKPVRPLRLRFALHQKQMMEAFLTFGTVSNRQRRARQSAVRVAAVRQSRWKEGKVEFRNLLRRLVRGDSFDLRLNTRGISAPSETDSCLFGCSGIKASMQINLARMSVFPVCGNLHNLVKWSGHATSNYGAGDAFERRLLWTLIELDEGVTRNFPSRP